MTSYDTEGNTTQSEIMMYNYFNSEIFNVISEFVNELADIADIIEDKKAFSLSLIKNYYKINLPETQINEYLTFVMQVVNMTEKHIHDILSNILLLDEKLKIVDIHCSLVKRSAVITFSHNRKIIFRNSSLNDEQIFNSIIRWVNFKVDERYQLYIRKIISYGSYGFLEYISSECDKQDITNSFFCIGQLLSLIYILNCKNFQEGKLLKLSRLPVLTNLEGLFSISERKLNFAPSSKNIAQKIIDSSVYNLCIIPKRHRYLAKLNISSIKLGFQYIYKIITNSKMEFIDFLNELFDKDSPYLAAVSTNVYNLNMNDLNRQLYFLDYQFNIKQNYKSTTKFSDNRAPNKINLNYYLELAVKLGNNIIQNSIIGVINNNTSRTWINTVECGDKIIISPECKNLYEGNSGIALFLLNLGVTTKKDYFINTAIEAMRESISNISTLFRCSSIELGAFNGICGEIYTLSKIYSITKDENVKKAVKLGLLYVKSAIVNQKDISLFSGLSGVLAVILAIYKNKHFSDIKVNLLAIAELAYKNILVNMDTISTTPGYYHGINGVIIVLINLLNLIGDTAIKSVIEELLKIERNFKFDKRFSNKTMLEVEHIGILLSRVFLKQYGYDDNLIDIEIDKALAWTIKKGFGNSPFYYNGDIGTLEVLEYTAKVLKDEVLRNRCNNTFANLVENTIGPNTNDENKLWSLSMSLMKGISGYGHMLLRKCSENIPNIVLLE